MRQGGVLVDKGLGAEVGDELLWSRKKKVFNYNIFSSFFFSKGTILLLLYSRLVVWTILSCGRESGMRSRDVGRRQDS